MQVRVTLHRIQTIKITVLGSKGPKWVAMYQPPYKTVYRAELKKPRLVFIIRINRDILCCISYATYDMSHIIWYIWYVTYQWYDIICYISYVTYQIFAILKTLQKLAETTTGSPSKRICKGCWSSWKWNWETKLTNEISFWSKKGDFYKSLIHTSCQKVLLYLIYSVI